MKKNLLIFFSLFAFHFFSSAQDSISRIEKNKIPKWEIGLNGGYGIPIAKSFFGAGFQGSGTGDLIQNGVNSTLGEGVHASINLSRKLCGDFSVIGTASCFWGTRGVKIPSSWNDTIGQNYTRTSYFSYKATFDLFAIGLKYSKRIKQITLGVSSSFALNAFGHISYIEYQKEEYTNSSSSNTEIKSTWDYRKGVGLGADFRFNFNYHFNEKISLGFSAFAFFASWAPHYGFLTQYLYNGSDNTSQISNDNRIIYFKKNAKANSLYYIYPVEGPLHYYPLNSGGIMLSFNYSFGKK